METIRVSSKGQVIIPKWIRDRYEWREGDELIVLDTGRGILLLPEPYVPPTTIDDVLNAIHYTGPAYSIEEMDAAIAEAFRTQPDDSH